MDAVCGNSRKRGQGVPSSEYGGILDCLQRAPNYLKNAVFEEVELPDGRHQWIHNVLLACYDVRMLSPDTMERYVPQEANLGDYYGPRKSKEGGGILCRRISKGWK